MTIDKPALKAMAEEWQSRRCAFGEPMGEMAIDPATILALLAENDELGRYLCTCRDCGGEGALHTGDWHSYSPMEPPEPVMEKCGECDGTGLLGEIQDLYQVITERDQLKAENEAMRHGMKGDYDLDSWLDWTKEAEALRKDAERYRWLREKSASDGEHTHGLCIDLWDNGSGFEVTLEVADAAIDEAMSKS
jgi:ferredoxin-thioredoxin reductase catalytic subunit